MFALVDCNNFYVSCERLFNPQLRNKPVVVLSNNDGCIVARSPEAKALGIEMASPYFKNRTLIRRHRVQVRSSNYALYGDLSSRVMNVLGQFAPNIEIYSIDEAFLELSGIPSLSAFGEDLAQKVLQWVGVPVSIGIAPTKVLAKLTTYWAKQSGDAMGNWLDFERPDDYLSQTPVGELWGIGRQLKKWCESRGIWSALDLRDAPEGMLRRKMGVLGVRMQWELQGKSCIPLDSMPAARKQTIVSRSFGKPITNLKALTEATTLYACRAAAKLRRQDQKASILVVFARTSPFKGNVYAKSHSHTFSMPTNNTHDFVKAAAIAIKQIYRPDYRFQKSGVICAGLSDANVTQGNLFHSFSVSDEEKRERLMKVIDNINRKYGVMMIRPAITGLQQSWRMKSDRRSPCYTTQWSDLPVIK